VQQRYASRVRGQKAWSGVTEPAGHQRYVGSHERQATDEVECAACIADTLPVFLQAVEGINTECPPIRATGQIVDGVALIRPVAVPWMRAYNPILLYCCSSTNSVNGARGSVAAFKPGRAAFGILRAH
jgi:hypothetical protein